MRFDVTPHIGANDLKLGMSRNEIRRVLGDPEYSMEKSVFEFQDISIPTPARDGYFENELQISFDDSGKANFIEFSGRGARHTTVFLYGLGVFDTPAPDLIKVIAEKSNTQFDQEDEEVPYTYTFRDIDVSIWRPVIPEQDENENQIPESDEGKYFWNIGIGITGYNKKK
jgi:hypothetical protein